MGACSLETDAALEAPFTDEDDVLHIARRDALIGVEESGLRLRDAANGVERKGAWICCHCPENGVVVRGWTVSLPVDRERLVVIGRIRISAHHIGEGEWNHVRIRQPVELVILILR